MPSFAQRFKQSLYSDCELAFRVQKQPDADGGRAKKRARTATQEQPGPEVIAAFPAHQVILCSSKYFEAQVQNWQTATSSTAAVSSSDGQADTDKLQLTLTIGSADELPAAEAVIAGLYGVEDALGQLEHHQLVQALIIADMIDADEVAQQASQRLEAVTVHEESLSEAALNCMADLAAWPPCLMQLLPSIVENARCCTSFTGTTIELDAVLAADKNKVMQRMLSSVFGDLQAAWRDEDLGELLMELPTPAMLLLLSSDELRVPSEDLVLFIAQQYARGAHVSGIDVPALARCIRAPHLSDVMLHYVVLSKDSRQSILLYHESELRKLLLLRRSSVGPGDTSYYEDSLRKLQGPKSWLLGQRQLVDAAAAVVEWRLPVEELKGACRQALARNNQHNLYGPSSPPVSGFGMSMVVFCMVVAGGVRIDLGVGPDAEIEGFYFNFSCEVLFNGQRHAKSVRCLESGLLEDWEDFFGVGPMSTGWDEAAWAAKGLPTSGEHLVLTLRVLSIS